MRTTRMILALMAALAAAACGAPEDGGGADGTPKVNGQFAANVEPVLAQHCYGCHSFTREGLLETMGTCFVDGELVQKPLVKAGDPEGSILWMKIANIDESFAYGREMPPNGLGGLIQEDPAGFAAIEAWIEAGAPE